MSRRIVVALLTPPAWAPPGVPPEAWREALAEDVVDLIAALAAADAGIAVASADRALADSLAWPSMSRFSMETSSVTAALVAATEAGYDQAAVIAGDAPDLPGLLVGKLLQPLTTRRAGVAPAHNGGLLGVSSRLPLPEWFPQIDLDKGTPDDLRGAAPRRAQVAVTPGWHRLRGPDDLRRLDPGLDGWDNTRLLLGG
ncbi:hypothetical protein Val02_70200 [Virgisporangium aliadipatigenens]|uniref:DUF2064 domain-containing protein n=1 Tax=Virgisporangium aliadipatigenens TaxID=741659 RepID=A0A8J3YQV4_9ACTN|nr:hypothetical protein [Virgisporangium aliadipatigenens]GIJ50134.1 hypothetical protein Val02_70200 [Virgisporangium aliadipatigenens]